MSVGLTSTKQHRYWCGSPITLFFGADTGSPPIALNPRQKNRGVPLMQSGLYSIAV